MDAAHDSEVRRLRNFLFLASLVLSSNLCYGCQQRLIRHYVDEKSAKEPFEIDSKLDADDESGIRRTLFFLLTKYEISLDPARLSAILRNDTQHLLLKKRCMIGFIWSRTRDDWLAALASPTTFEDSCHDEGLNEWQIKLLFAVAGRFSPLHLLQQRHIQDFFTIHRARFELLSRQTVEGQPCDCPDFGWDQGISRHDLPRRESAIYTKTLSYMCSEVKDTMPSFPSFRSPVTKDCLKEDARDWELVQGPVVEEDGLLLSMDEDDYEMIECQGNIFAAVIDMWNLDSFQAILDKVRLAYVTRKAHNYGESATNIKEAARSELLETCTRQSCPSGVS